MSRGRLELVEKRLANENGRYSPWSYPNNPSLRSGQGQYPYTSTVRSSYKGMTGGPNYFFMVESTLL